MSELKITNQKLYNLWEGCIIASIAHAIMVAHYPEISHEHSWDHNNYNVQNSQGTRGTITFYDDQCVASFRNDLSERCNLDDNPLDTFFKNAPNNIISIAQEETLQYLLVNKEGVPTPLITTAFWISENKLYSTDSLESLYKHGGDVIKWQLMSNDRLQAWKEYYGMNKKQYRLFKELTKKKIKDPNKEIKIPKYKKSLIGKTDYLEESKISLSELNIILS